MLRLLALSFIHRYDDFDDEMDSELPTPLSIDDDSLPGVRLSGLNSEFNQGTNQRVTHSFKNVITLTQGTQMNQLRDERKNV